MSAAKNLPDIVEEALTRLDSPSIATSTMCKVLDWMPVPVAVFDIDETISWANRCMLSLSFGVPDGLIGFPGESCFGQRIVDVFPSALAQYVLPRNARVWSLQVPQYESWQDQDKPGVQWDVIRYPVNTTKICAVLVPKDSETVHRCHSTLAKT